MGRRNLFRTGVVVVGAGIVVATWGLSRQGPGVVWG